MGNGRSWTHGVIPVGRVRTYSRPIPHNKRGSERIVGPTDARDLGVPDAQAVAAPRRGSGTQRVVSVATAGSTNASRWQNPS